MATLILTIVSIFILFLNSIVKDAPSGDETCVNDESLTGRQRESTIQSVVRLTRAWIGRHKKDYSRFKLSIIIAAFVLAMTLAIYTHVSNKRSSDKANETIGQLLDENKTLESKANETLEFHRLTSWFIDAKNMSDGYINSGRLLPERLAMAAKTWNRTKTPDSKEVKRVFLAAFDGACGAADTTFNELEREFGVKVNGSSFETQLAYRKEIRALFESNEQLMWNHIDDAIGAIMQWSRSVEAAINESLSIEYQSRLAGLNKKYQVEVAGASAD